MILVDTSVWVDHLRSGSPPLAALLDRGDVLGHPWVVGELALGHLGQRQETIRLLDALPQAAVATPREIVTMVERHELFGAGIGYVDAQLLAATMITPATRLWTTDRRLLDVAVQLNLGFDPNAG